MAKECEVALMQEGAIYPTARLKDSSVDCVMQMRRDMTMKKNKVSSLRGEARHCRHRIIRTYGKDGQRTRAEMNREKKPKHVQGKQMGTYPKSPIHLPNPSCIRLGDTEGMMVVIQ